MWLKLAIFVFFALVTKSWTFCTLNCCPQACCPTCATICPTNCVPTTPSPTTPPTNDEVPTPERLAATIPPSTNIDTASNLSNNLTNLVNMSTIINNVNRIDNPITVHTSNTNHITLTGGGDTRKASVMTVVKPCQTTPNPTLPESTTPRGNPTTTSSTPLLSSTPLPSITTPAPPAGTTPPSAGEKHCCLLMVPCVHDYCSEYRFSCGTYCQSGRRPYLPRNPCLGGCGRRASYRQVVCGDYGCQPEDFGCGNCEMDFYRTYSEYRRCRGCFYQ